MRLASLLAAAALLAGCAVQPQRPAPPFKDPRLTVDAASQAMVAGRTTKQETRALLGEPEAVPFATGWEAWVYRARDDRGPREELVLLFDPAGVLTKLRVRPADPARP